MSEHDDSPESKPGAVSPAQREEVHRALEGAGPVTNLPFYEERRQERNQGKQECESKRRRHPLVFGRRRAELIPQKSRQR